MSKYHTKSTPILSANKEKRTSFRFVFVLCVTFTNRESFKQQIRQMFPKEPIAKHIYPIPSAMNCMDDAPSNIVPESNKHKFVESCRLTPSDTSTQRCSSCVTKIWIDIGAQSKQM